MGMLSRKSIGTVVDESLNFGKKPAPGRVSRCEHCGASSNSTAISIREIAGAVVFGGLLLTLLALAGHVVYRWIERDGETPFEPPVWHEPLNSWSL